VLIAIPFGAWRKSAIRAYAAAYSRVRREKTMANREASETLAGHARINRTIKVI
jgi:hypothetical protein